MPTWRVPVNLTWQGPGSPGVNVWHVRTAVDENTWPNTELQEAVDNIHTFYASIAAVSLGNSYVFASGTTISLGTVATVDTQREQVPAWTNIVETAGYNVAPPHLAICVGWRTATAARRARGRTFLGPLGVGCMEGDGSVAAAALTAVRDAASALVASSQTVNGWAIGVYGQETAMGGNVTPQQRAAAPHVLRDITGTKTRDLFAVLRKRRD